MRKARKCSICNRAYFDTIGAAEAQMGKAYKIHICPSVECKEKAWKMVRNKFKGGEGDDLQETENID